MSWRNCFINDIVLEGKGNLVSGPFGSNISRKFFVPEGVPVIRGSNLPKDNSRFYDQDFVFITKEKAYELRNCIALPDDILFTSAGTVGDVGLIPKNVRFDKYIISNKQIRLRVNTKLIIPVYVYYWLKQIHIRKTIENLNTGSSIPLLTLGSTRKIPISFPDIEIQKRIVLILSAYDELIENNLKQINLLEQAAENIYKEWFVNMRFPGHESAEFDSETGLPEGWKKGNIKDYVKVASKGPSLNYNTDSGIPVLNQSCVRNKEIELDKVRYAEKLKDNKSHCYLQINDILINSMGQGTLGRVSKNNSIKEKFIIHNCITFLRAKDIYSQAYLFHFISSKEDYFISIAQGSTGQTTLKLELVTSLDITIPATRLLKAFDEIVLDFWSQIGNLKQQNVILNQARDILLPRLMNQTIEV